MAIQDALPLTFGVYPGGYAGGGTDRPVPNDEPQIHAALDALQGDAPNFLVRGYSHYKADANDGTGVGDDPADAIQYLRAGRRLDLVLEYSAGPDDVDGWLAFVREAIRRDGRSIATLSVTLEENLDYDPAGREALVRGVVEAKREALACGHAELEVGFCVASFGIPYDLDFWRDLAARGGADFAPSVDYVGVDLYPGVFPPPVEGVKLDDMRADLAAALSGPMPNAGPDETEELVLHALRLVRERAMPLAGLGSDVKMRITENGWPTGPGRSEEDQARVVCTTVETIHAHRAELNVASYEHFALRDALSSSPSRFDQLGLLRDDYAPKPAFDVYRRLVTELGA
jgi:hypothetical protein